MDLPCPEWTKHAEQRWVDLGSAGRQSFSLLTDIDDILQFAEARVLPEDLEVLSRISENFAVRKFVERSATFRKQGNLSFKAKDYKSAALHYSKGVCHAGENTEHLSLCYANRSAALFHLGNYSKCLEDIQRALDEGYPSHLQCKLLDRRMQCVNRLKEQDQSKALCSKHQAAEQEECVTCLSPGVSIQFTSEKGRCLLATENKKAGETVVKDKAFSLVLIPGNGHEAMTDEASVSGTEHRYCHHCLCCTLSVVPCVGCSYAQYCGQRCANEAWRQYHWCECPAGSELLALGVLAHLALRVTLKAGLKEVQRAREMIDVSGRAHVGIDTGGGNLFGEGSYCLEDSLGLSEVECSGFSSYDEKESYGHSGCYHGRSYLGVYSLLPHVGNHSPSLCFLLAFTMAVLCQRLKEVGPSPDSWTNHEQEGRGFEHWGAEQSIFGPTALRHMMQLLCNAQAVTAIRVKEDKNLAVQSSGEVRIATAVFPILSLLNHSCFPNTSISFNLGHHSSPGCCSSSGVTVSIKTFKDIPAGQELLHCYGPHYSRMDVKKRQQLLLEQYFFQCQCEACELELASGTGKLALASHGLKCEQCGSSLQANADVHVCSQSSCDYHISDTALQGRMQLLTHHLHKASELLKKDRVDEALRVLKEAATQADSILMKTHPVQGELADAMARVYATLGDWRQAASHLKRSVPAVCSQYGEDSVELGRQLFKLTQLHFNGRNRQSALSVIPRARHLLSLHCDRHCQELQELQEMEACLHVL